MALKGPFSIDNVSTGDDYAGSATLEGPPSARLKLQIYNASVDYELQYGGHHWQAPVFSGPWVGTRDLPGVTGIRFKSHTPGKPAQVSAELLPDEGVDQGVVPGITVGSSGEVTNLVSVPTGGIIPWAGSAPAPSADWLICDGSIVRRADYPNLFSVIGTTYGAGDGSTTFGIPDLRDRVAVGVGLNSVLGANDGVAAANRHGTRHRHTPHHHSTTVNVQTAPSPNFNPASIAAPGAGVTGDADGGSGVGTDPLDGAAFLALTYLIRAT